MNLSNFLHFNKICPVCGEPLTLYAQVLDGPLWKSFKVGNVYHFRQLKCNNKDFADEDFLWVTDNEDGTDIDFSSAKIYQNSKTWTFFFFFMCNEDGIEDAPRESYGINPCTACYYRSSAFLEFKQNENKDWRLVRANGTDVVKGDIRDEIFSFSSEQAAGGEKMYVLNLDYETEQTSLRYYSVSEAERTDRDFDPKILKIDLPILNVRPNFDLSQRDKLIDRFDSWILMS